MLGSSVKCRALCIFKSGQNMLLGSLVQVAEISSQARFALEQARKELQAAERQAEEARSQVGQ